MILAGKSLVVLDLHQLASPRMERIEDQNLERRTPGIVTLSRQGSGKSHLAARSVMDWTGVTCRWHTASAWTTMAWESLICHCSRR